MVQVASFLDRILDDLFGPRGLGQLPHGDHIGPGLDDLLDLVADLAQVDIQVLQDVGGDAAALLDQAEQDVFRADVLVVEALGLLVGQLHHLSSTVGEAFIHAVDSDGITGPVPVQNRTRSNVPTLSYAPSTANVHRNDSTARPDATRLDDRGDPDANPRSLILPAPLRSVLEINGARNPSPHATRWRWTEPDSSQIRPDD